MIEAKLIDELREIVGDDNVLTSPAELLCYSYDSTVLQHLPEIVVLPRTAAEVAAVVKLASRDIRRADCIPIHYRPVKRRMILAAAHRRRQRAIQCRF